MRWKRGGVKNESVLCQSLVLLLKQCNIPSAIFAVQYWLLISPETVQHIYVSAMSDQLDFNHSSAISSWSAVSSQSAISYSHVHKIYSILFPIRKHSGAGSEFSTRASVLYKAKATFKNILLPPKGYSYLTRKMDYIYIYKNIIRNTIMQQPKIYIY